MHGARAVVHIGGTPVGIFSQISYSVTYDVQPVFTLGRFSAIEIVYTGAEPVSVSASGYRVISSDAEGQRGPHGELSVPKLDELLNNEDTTICIYDRQNTAKPILNVIGIKPTGYSTSISRGGLQEISVNFVGLIASDETGAQAESAGSTSL